MNLDNVTKNLSFFMILTHLGLLVKCWSIFAYGLDFTEIFAYAKNSAVSLTLMRQTPRCQRHREVKRDFYNFSKDFFQLLKVFSHYFFMVKTHPDPWFMGYIQFMKKLKVLKIFLGDFKIQDIFMLNPCGVMDHAE